MPTAVLGQAAAAVGITWISTFGNLGGFFGPYVVGFLKQASGVMILLIFSMVGCLALGIVLTMLLPKRLVNR